MQNVKFPAWQQVTLLTIAAFVLRCYMAMLDPFLHTWDECFHALVARNMMDEPFVPMLRKGQLLPYDYRQWVSNTVWLHKQPLFLWQMALSMKLFAVSTFTLRLPSAIMGALMAPMIYQVCRLMRSSHFTAITAAAMYCCCYYQLELTAGYFGMDHNDVAFSFYVFASIWAYANYVRSGNWKWLLLIGLFAGCAILCKWLAGLLVYAGWLAGMLATLQKKDIAKQGLHFLGALAVTIVVALPWQLYTLHKFRNEARYELSFNARHLREVVEGHSGSWSYYFEFFPRYFGDTICCLVPPGLLLMLLSKSLHRPIRFALCAMFMVGVIFYSFIAKTKVYSYLVPLLPIGFIAIAYCADCLLDFVKRFRIMYAVLVTVLALLFCNLTLKWGEIESGHTDTRGDRVAHIARSAVYRRLSTYLQPGTEVVLNMPQWEDIELMFYNNQLQAYSQLADSNAFALLANQKMRIAYFPSAGVYQVPDYVKDYPGSYMLPVRLAEPFLPKQ